MTRRVIRPLPTVGIHPAPAGAWLTDGRLDYEDEGTDAAPADALYVAEKDAAGAVVEKVNKLPPGKAHRKDRDGWPDPGKVKLK